jgi:hypothetical protein
MIEQQSQQSTSPVLRSLMLTCFEVARAKGLAHWQTMNIGVLKNRLLQTTHGGFNEVDYGFSSFRDLVASMPDLLELDTTQAPPEVTLLADLDAVSTAALHTLGDQARIRADLWNAIMDYSHGVDWVWDGKRAVPRKPEDGNLAVMPSVNSEILRDWRREFLAGRGYASLGDDVLEPQMRDWLQTGALTKRLPPSIRRPWNAYLKQRVLSRITAYFDGIGATVPADVLTGGHRAVDTARASTASLRTFVEACVAVMTEAELAHLPIPAAAASQAMLRLTQQASPRSAPD